MARVFISHATVDRPVVTRDIIDLLGDHGIDVWFAEDDIATARQWERSILEGLKECDWFLVALSPHAVKSEWVKDEVHWAIKERPERIVPVLMEECDLGDIHIRLPRIQYVDFRKVNDDTRQRLLDCWGMEYRSAARARLRFHPLGDRYSIVEQLIARDFLTEYLARDTALNRSVLIKCDTNNRDYGDRRHPVATEVHATASFFHPAIPRVFDLGHDPELGVYSVLEHTPGVTLRDQLKDNCSLPAARVVGLMEPLCDAVHYANQHKVIHRNIKPGSVVVDENCRLYLTNFVVARVGDQSEVDGHVVGTPMYMAPEQCEGRADIDCRVDVWGLGALLYEMLTGKLPFPRESLGQGSKEFMHSILSDGRPIPLREYDRSIPKTLEAICLRCLEKDREDRYSTALDLAAALTNWRGRKGRLWSW